MICHYRSLWHHKCPIQPAVPKLSFVAVQKLRAFLYSSPDYSIYSVVETIYSSSFCCGLLVLTLFVLLLDSPPAYEPLCQEHANCPPHRSTWTSVPAFGTIPSLLVERCYIVSKSTLILTAILFPCLLPVTRQNYSDYYALLWCKFLFTNYSRLKLKQVCVLRHWACRKVAEPHTKSDLP